MSSTTWIVREEDTDEQQCLDTSSSLSWRTITREGWRDISQEFKRTLHSVGSGGGALCTEMCWSSVEAVVNVRR